MVKEELKIVEEKHEKPENWKKKKPSLEEKPPKKISLQEDKQN